MNDGVTRFRHVIAPAVGALGILSAMVGMGLSPSISVVFGALVWGGTLLVLTPPKRFKGVLSGVDNEEDARRIAGELHDASERIGKLRAFADTFEAVALRRSLLAIAGSAQAIMDDLERDPKDYRRVRKALTHYLGHTVQITDRFVYMNKMNQVDHEVAERTARVLGDMELVFQDYTRRMVDDEAFDLDARIQLLEQEIKAEGLKTKRSHRP